MHEQTQQREERLLERDRCRAPVAAVVAVVAGRRQPQLFESLGATRIVEGGQTMNPSTAELVEAIGSTPKSSCCRTTPTSSSRRAGRAARRQAGRGRPDRLDPGGPRGDGRLRRVAHGRRERGRDARGRRGRQDRRGDDRLARRADERPLDPQGRLARPRRRRGRRRWPDFAEVAERSSSACWPSRATC